MNKVCALVKEFFASLVVAFSVLGCVLGAGFLSGAEIYSFFVRFGYYGIVGTIVCATLFGAIVYFVAKQNLCIFNTTVGKQVKQQTNTNTIMQFCGLVVAATMLAGTNKILVGFGCPVLVSNVVVFVCLFVALLLGLKFAKGVNVAVTSLALIFIGIIIATSGVIKSGANYFGAAINVNIFSLVSAIALAISYAAMNAISSYTIIASVGGNATDKQHTSINRCRNVAVWCGFIMGALVLVLFAAICSSAAGGDMPMLSLAGSGVLRVLYCILLVVAMLSTLFSCAIGGQKLFITRWGKIGSCMLVSMLCQLLSFVGFGNLIRFGYPLIGGIAVANFVIKILIKHKNLSKKIPAIKN